MTPLPLFGAFKVGANSKSPNQHAYVERQGTGTGIRFRFTPIAGKLQFGFSAKDGVADTSYTYNTKWDDRWHVASFSARLGGDKPSYEMTLDAVTVASGTLVVPAEVTEISDTVSLGIYVGNHSRLASGESFDAKTAWHGLIDDIAIFDQSVGQGEMTAYVTSKKRWDEQQPTGEPVDEHLIVYWPFDENTGTFSTDRGSTVVDLDVPEGEVPAPHGPAATMTFYTNNVASNLLWAKDRPYLGNGITDTVAPTTPTSPVTSAITSDGFTAAWGVSTDNIWVQFYELQVSEFANFTSYTAYDTGILTTRKITNLLPATNYYWRVRASNNLLQEEDL
jgi:hypothetical protein